MTEVDVERTRQQEFVLRTLTERDIRFVRLWFTDVLGMLKSVSVAPAEIESAFSDGIGFDGSAIEGFARAYEADMVALPDPATFQIFPFEGGDSGESARMFCDIALPDGSPAPSDPRHVLRRVLERALRAGFTFYTHPEIEFFLLEQPTGNGVPVPIDTGGYFDHTAHVVAHDFRRRAVQTLEQLGISVEYSHHECAPGQQEIDLRMADALATADNVMTFRHIVKEVALAQGAHATFMPKPFTEQAGSAMHTHVSLFAGERNAFFDDGDPIRLSTVGRQFLAGLLRHAREWTAVTNQWVNSYKRLFPQPIVNRLGEAPSAVCWGSQNRSALVRVPMFGGENSARVEVRSPDPACNPYLAFAVLLGAGLAGIEGEYELPPGATDDVWSLTEAQRRSAGFQSLPRNLAEAVAVMEGSELMRSVLGEHVFEFFIRNKRAEVEEYDRQVTEYERDRYLGSL